jgi:hypothetical protein
MADKPLSIDDISRPAGEVSAKEKDDLSSISSAAQPEADVIDAAKEYAKGLVQGLTEQAPSAGGLYGGARLGFQAGTRIPFGQPYTTVAATVAGGLTGLVGGSQLGEQLYKKINEEQPTLSGLIVPPQAPNPELKPFREAGKTTGGGLAFLPLGYTIPATTGVRVLDFIGKLGTFARSHPILYGALETQSAVGSGIGAGVAEATFPGETGPRITGEVVGGLLNPSKLITTASLPLVDLIKRGVSRFSAGQREARAANRLAAILEESFQPELRQADPEKWADAYNNDYLPRLIQALKDPGIVPGMTSAQKTGDLPLTVLETSLARQNDEFGPKVAEQGRKAQEAVIRMINMLNQSGDPTMLQEAARLRDSYLRQLLDGRLAAADAKSAIAIAGISKDSPANRARIGQIIRDNVDSALKDAREVEHTLWSDVPKAIRAQVDETVAAMQKQGANKDQIQAAVARLTDGQAVVANSFTKQFDAIRSEMSPEYYNREFPAIVKDIYGRLSRARTVKGTPPDQLFALGKEANPELATALSTAQKDLQTTKASIDASSEITKRLANITKDGKYTLEVRVPEAPYRRTLDLTSAPDKRALAKKLIDVTTGKLPRESLSDAMRDYEIVGIYKGKGDNATEITFKELTDLKQVGSLKETYTTLQNQIKDTQKNLIESGKDFVRRGAINVGDLVNARRDMLRLAMDAEARGERANYAFYSKFSEALLDDMEQVRNPAYDAARAFSKELNDSFTRTFAGDMRAVGKTGAERIIPEVLVSRAFSGNSDIVNARLQQIQDAVDMLPRLHSQYVADFGPNDPRTRILEDAVNRAGPRAVSTADAVDRATRLAAAASIDPQTNRLNTTRLSRWLNENETLVNSIPGLRYDLENSIRAQNSLDLITKQNSAISKKIDKQVAFSKFLGENPSEAVADAINSKNPALSMRRLAQAASTGMGKGQNQDMVDALKSAIYDYAYAKAGGDKLNFKAYNDAFFAPTSTGRPALADILVDSGVMNRGEIANIKKLTGELARVEAVMGNKQVLERVLETSDAVEDLVLRVIGARMGAGVAEGGSTLIAASAGSKMMREMFDRMPNESVRGLLEQASRDPAFMVRLLEKGRSEQDKIRFAKQLRGYLINAGLTAAEEEEQPAAAPPTVAERTAERMLKKLPPAPQARGLLSSFAPAQQPGRPQARTPAGQPQPQAREMLQRLFPFDAVLR